ncbi:Transport protein particle (TRAPP) component Bet3-like protein B [Monocercomonoides exilis]|uniref:Transport protein particle (TRAPP) component Bet3-like protein B n=1 Tax=Monocercomonoides exilis TaxID=2049356 RepID=UPI003559B2ED|nr:Transport protein particle (TRAPP) component Bet3-like protein B [Monocercomonoides exilis]|eukprot:MONOS_8379.1-p1 / transcript=MONOS_8379.1 / gene=MONOS_8379 / organism=Monocercomonoides_exilis_PA203 / gene_product= Transport protein particle (TRAPP) component Bet3 paralogue B / transcript_product= Transport protein particle (TRAPP) component Bet3 paralogue B / location=Mono_scaffold00314:59860-60519(+) / protein_length=186 / sequence_SO=supercontig / SO=protein_coding / is_pseudo=false
MASSSTVPSSRGEIFSKYHIPSDFLAITYGCLIDQLVQDYGDPNSVSQIVQKMGVHMGKRMADEILAKSNPLPCTSYKQSVDACAQIGFKMLLNVDASVTQIQDNIFIISFQNNPLTEFVELPSNMKKLWYSNVICGVIEGVFDTLKLNVACSFIADKLRDADINQIKIEVKGATKETISESFET